MSLIKAHVTGKFLDQGTAVRALAKPGDVAIVHREIPRWIIFACPDGCGAIQPVNLDSRAGPAWEMYGTSRRPSLFPSVWRDSGCKSHFILWRGDIHLLDNDYWLPDYSDAV